MAHLCPCLDGSRRRVRAEVRRCPIWTPARATPSPPPGCVRGRPPRQAAAASLAWTLPGWPGLPRLLSPLLLPERPRRRLRCCGGRGFDVGQRPCERLARTGLGPGWARGELGNEPHQPVRGQERGGPLCQVHAHAGRRYAAFPIERFAGGHVAPHDHRRRRGRRWWRLRGRRRASSPDGAAASHRSPRGFGGWRVR